MLLTALSKVVSFHLFYLVFIWNRLSHELENSGVGCYMDGVLVGATGYANDLQLLTPSVNELNILVDICNNYAAKY